MDTLIKEREYVRNMFGAGVYVHHVKDFGFHGEESAKRYCAVEQLAVRNYRVTYFGTRVLYLTKKLNATIEVNR